MTAAPDEQLIAREMKRARSLLRDLVGETVPAITISSISADEAPLLARTVSKLSPLIGNLLEARVVASLSKHQGKQVRWQRQDPEFPDAGMFTASGRPLQAGFEVKAWYALSTEVTGRFRESSALLEGRSVDVVVVAWAMSHLVFGTPEILELLIVPARQLAAARDQHYHHPPDYLVLEPGDTAHRTKNLRQTVAAGYKWQETSPAQLAKAKGLVQKLTRDRKAPAAHAEQELVRKLMSKFSYRLDTNFAKLDRICDPDIEAFKQSVLAQQHADRTLKQWGILVRQLDSESPEVSAKASEAIVRLYEVL